MPIDLPAPDADELAHSRQLTDHLREEIIVHGPMAFSRYMERCLYAPGLGYYSAGRRKFGPTGDFVTAPELGPLFARCVARAVAPMLRFLGASGDFLELGGGSGVFAVDVLTALDRLDALPRRYWLLEPSADLRQRQQQHLRAQLPAALFARVAWLERPPEADWQGVLFANEVIDALPATRFTLRAGEVYEEHVALDGAGTLHLVDRPADALVAGAVRHLERDLDARFADGYRSELLPQLPYWLQAVAGSLQQGAMLFVDYGYVRREFYRPERDQGTLLAHYRHRAHADVLWHPGLQDLTASVDFTALAEAGNSAGFQVAAYLPQSAFLIAAGLEEVFAEAVVDSADAAASYAVAQQVKHLTLPGEMGERFQAMLLVRTLEGDVLPAAVLAADQGGRL
ncbi:MAG TPA: SAM-dependent methyltransferase [Rhodanobacteraceae bacterium]|nr:SAM-dependent methyltransferase [Rhodanobacteraceae bacterium]